MKIRNNSAWVVMLLWSVLALGQGSNIDQGTVAGSAYVNHFFGLTFTRPTALNYEANLARAHPQDRAFVLIKAVGNNLPGQVTSLLILSADKLSYYPSTQKSVAAYLSKIEHDEEKNYGVRNT